MLCTPQCPTDPACSTPGKVLVLSLGRWHRERRRRRRPQGPLAVVLQALLELGRLLLPGENDDSPEHIDQDTMDAPKAANDS